MPFGQCSARNLFVPGAEHHAIDTGFACASSLAEPGWHARQVKQFDHHMFQNVTGPGAFLQALQESTFFAHTAMMLSQSRQPCHEFFSQARDFAGRQIFQCAQIKPDFQGRTVSPDIGTTQILDAQQANIVFHR